MSETKTVTTPARTLRWPQSRPALRVALSGHGLFGRFGYLLASQSVLLIGGLAYWTIATRTIAARSVGIASAGVSTASLLASLGVLGIGSLLLSEMAAHRAGEVRTVVSTGAAIAGGIAAILALGLWPAMRWLGPSLRAIGDDPLDTLLFVVGASINAVGIVFDCAAIGLRRSPAQLARNLAAAICRVTLTAIAVSLLWREATTLLVVWVAAGALSLVISPRLLHLERPAGGRPTLRDRYALVRRLGPVALRHHVMNLAITSVTFVLPVIAALTVPSNEYAYFSVALLIAGCVLIPPALLALALFAETTGDEELLRHQIRRTFPIAMCCCVAALVVVEPLAHLVLAPFGAEYVEHSATPLRLLLLGGIPYVVKDHFVSIRRAQRRLTVGAREVAIATMFEFAGAVTGALLFGINGLCAGWAIAAGVESLRFAPAVASVALASTHATHEAVASSEPLEPSARR